MAAALYHRERTGLGQEVSVSLLNSYVTAHEISWQEWSVSGGESEPIRAGNVHPIVGGVGVFSVGDEGHIVIAAVNDKQWRSTCTAMGRPELASDPRYATAAGRVTNRDEVTAVIEQWLANETGRDDVVAKLESNRVPAAPVLSIAEAARHPQLIESGALRWVHDDVLGDVLIPGMSIRFLTHPDDLELQHRELGEDNRHVVCDVMGKSAAEYEALVAAGVLRHDPAT